jgi:site-specific recombinase XerD/ribosomal protein L40E
MRKRENPAPGTLPQLPVPDRFKEEKTVVLMSDNGAGGVREDIYNSRHKLEVAIRRLQPMRNGETAIEFLQYLQASGLSTIRVVRYGMCLTKILNSIDIQRAGRKEIEAFIAELNRSDYKAWTKHAYKLTVKKLFQYLRYGNTSKDTPYPEEVAWISLRISEAEIERNSRASADKLLSTDEITQLLKATNNPRDEAMLLVLFEGAFRPGELLVMRVGSVQFLKDYCIISTKGKTGQKRIPLVVSLRPLMRWLSVHPSRNDPEAPLWVSLDTGHRGNQLSYRYFRETIAKTAARAGLQKDVWPYLFRHSQLTSMADKLTDSKLTLFAGWTLGTKMVRRYVHWSGRDLDRSLLAIHGLTSPEAAKAEVLDLVSCPRCSAKNSPSSARCDECGYIIDKKFAIQVEDDVSKRLGRLEDMIKALLDGQQKADSPAL